MNQKQQTKQKGKQDRVKQLEEEIKQLALTIDEVEDEKQKINEQLLKALADYANLEKSIDSRIEGRLQSMRLDLGKSVIEVLDDVNMAKEALEKTEMNDAAKAWAQGVVATLEKLNEALDKIGLKPMEVKKGDTFDSSRHEAIGVVDEGENGTIHQVVQHGYTVGEQVVRPARVLVNKRDDK